MKKKLVSFTCLALFAISALGTGKKKPEPTPTPVATAAATAAPTPLTQPTGRSAKAPKKPAVDAKPDPAADYKGFDDANLDGKKAFGKTVLTRMYRHDTKQGTFTGFSCIDKGSSNHAYLRYSDSQRSSVRAMPSGYTRDECPRVLFKITGFYSPYYKVFKGELVEILDVTPEETEAAPAGADYASLDAAQMDGPAKYKGKIVGFEARRTDIKEKEIRVSECGGGSMSMKVKFKPEQRDDVKSISNDYQHCTTIKVKLGAPYYSTLSGELLEVK